MIDNETVVAELQALKILILSFASSLPNADSVVEKYLKRLGELEAHALYEAIISDSMREAIVQYGKGYASTIQKWSKREDNSNRRD